MADMAWRELPDLFLSQGVTWFTADQAAVAAGAPVEAAATALRRLAGRGLVFSPARGMWVAIPAEYRTWGGAVPAERFIDPLMAHLGCGYHAAYLTAAQMHGAAHQRPQVFQVATDRRVRDRAFGRVRLRFYLDASAGRVPTEQRQTDTGYLTVSTPEATLLGLVSNQIAGGGIDNIATVAIELAGDGKLDPARLARAASVASAAAVSRAGWLLDRFTSIDTSGLHPMAASSPTALETRSGRRGPIDGRWNIIENAVPDPDV